MERKELDRLWFAAHPILWYVLVACICFASARAIDDFRILWEGGTPKWNDYALAIFVAAGVVLGQALRQRRERRVDAEQSRRGDSAKAADGPSGAPQG